jgi:hypothetical protein
MLMRFCTITAQKCESPSDKPRCINVIDEFVLLPLTLAPPIASQGAVFAFLDA